MKKKSIERREKVKVRNIQHLPVFLEEIGEVIAVVDKAVIGDDFGLLYLVVEAKDGQSGIIFRDDFELTTNSVLIWNRNSIKSYAHGEELSMVKKKVGDRIYSRKGKELGNVSDFVINPALKNVEAVEITSGTLADLVHGRQQVPLEQVVWTSDLSAVVHQEGSESQ